MSGVALRLAKAQEALDDARFLMTGNRTKEAGRLAYMAAFHAAQALIAARTGKSAKTHSGVRTEFSRLAQQEASLDRSFVAFLGRAYELKTYADYGYEAGVHPVSTKNALDMATNFVDAVASLVAGDPLG